MQLRQYQLDGKNAVIGSEIGQLIAPTGTGKSVIQGAIFEELIVSKCGFGIYVILTPRIMLTNQLMQHVGNHLINSNIEIRTLTIHSGKPANFDITADDDIDDWTRFIYSNIGMVRTTDGAEAATAIKEAKHKNRPLLVCCTYDSAPALCRAIRIMQEECPETVINQVLCDEAHYIVEKKFFANIAEVKQYTERIHFFTATQKITAGDFGNGMNNEDFYGPVVFRCTPYDMIHQGYMVRPRIHYELAEEGTPWSRMVADAFEEHQLHVSYNAKMLVCCNGSKTIKEIVNAPGFRDWCKEQDITVFDVSSAYGANINGIEVDRNSFLKSLREHTGKAIILHINILTEGIDVPDITGVMFIRNMGITRFLQSIGRATRVLPMDVGKPTDNFDVNSAKWTKPYAWAIIAERDDDNEGKLSALEDNITKMREAGFEPMEEVVIAIDRGKKEKAEFKLCNAVDKKIKTTFADLFDIYHHIELEKLAALSNEDLFQLPFDFTS